MLLSHPIHPGTLPLRLVLSETIPLVYSDRKTNCNTFVQSSTRRYQDHPTRNHGCSSSWEAESRIQEYFLIVNHRGQYDCRECLTLARPTSFRENLSSVTVTFLVPGLLVGLIYNPLRARRPRTSRIPASLRHCSMSVARPGNERGKTSPLAKSYRVLEP